MTAVQTFGVDVVVLDDAFQHIQLERISIWFCWTIAAPSATPACCLGERCGSRRMCSRGVMLSF